MSKYNWLTEKISNSLSRQVGEEGAEEGADEWVLQESHVLVRAGGVQLQTGKCRDQTGEEIHLWKNNLFVTYLITSLSLIALSKSLLIRIIQNKWRDEITVYM